MDVLIIDLTHGGVKIAVEMKKLGNFNSIYAYDIYNTLKKDDKQLLDSYGIKVLYNSKDIKTDFDNSNNLKEDFDNNNINNKILEIEEFLNNLNSKELLVVNPVHSPFGIYSFFNFKSNNNKNNNNSNSSKLIIKEITHHQAIKLILKNWKEKTKAKDIPVIEVTGVKGKTSVVAMLKEIIIDKNPLVLSSLGACYYKYNKKVSLKKNISITPASILESIDLVDKIANSKCNTISKMDYLNENNNKLPYDSGIFESSLGVTGLGDIGVLTNIVENYSIANNSSNASNAKKQVFNCDIVVIEKETLEKYYPKKGDRNNENNKNNKKINTFSFNDRNANLFLEELDYSLNNTIIKITYKNIKTISGKIINGNLIIDTFAPGKHHVSNVLATVTTALSCDINENVIVKGLSNFKGIKGRTSLKLQDNLVVIEEINPGINTKAIESSIKMIDALQDYVVIIGGKYGVTCEEIDENKVSNLLDILLDIPSEYLNDQTIKEDNDFYLRIIGTINK